MIAAATWILRNLPPILGGFGLFFFGTFGLIHINDHWRSGTATIVGVVVSLLLLLSGLGVLLKKRKRIWYYCKSSMKKTKNWQKPWIKTELGWLVN